MSDIHEQVNHLIAGLELMGAFDPQPTLEESLRRYLASQWGDQWLECVLQANLLKGNHTVYTAMLIEPMVATMDEYNHKYALRSFTVDRDEFGQFYIAPPSPVTGYES